MWVKRCEKCSKDNSSKSLVCRSCGSPLDRVEITSTNGLYKQTYKNIKFKRSNHGKEIGGWLIVIFLGMVTTIANQFVIIFKDYLPMFTNGTWRALHNTGTSYSILILFELIAGCIFGLFLAFTIVLFFMRKRNVPKMMILFCTGYFIYFLTDYLISSNIQHMTGNEKYNLLDNNVRNMLVCTIGVSYFLLSKRVKETFVR